MIEKNIVFYGKVIEEAMLIGYGFGFSSEFQLGEEYRHRDIYNNKLYRHERVAKQEVFFKDISKFDFEIGWKVRLGKDVVFIEDVVHQTDGTVEYYTNKVVKRIQVNPNQILIPKEEIEQSRRKILISSLVDKAKDYGIEVYEGELHGDKVYQIKEQDGYSKLLSIEELSEKLLPLLQEQERNEK